jgi:hypothetical protein
MRPRNNSWANWLGGLALAWSCSARAASVASDWQHEQQFDIAAPGLVKLSLPVETLDSARPGLDDLRLYDDTGELPYLLERPVPAGKVSQSARSFKVSLNPANTEGQPVSSNLTVPVESQVRSRQLLLLISNQDSPPLPVSAVRVERRPVYVVFFARQACRHRLLSGNNRCAAPSYDLASLATHLKTVAVLPAKFSALTDNAGYHSPEILPGVEEEGAALDVTAWKFRKAVRLDRGGAEQVELDLDVLSHAQAGFQDLRLLRHGKQLPFILERTSISRVLTPAVTATNDAKDAKLSRWVIQLSHPRLPVTRLSCAARTTLFQREATLYEEVSDDRGEKRRRTLGRASWVQTPERASKEFILLIESLPEGNTLFLETHNGDNPPLELNSFRLFYPATRVLFKAKPGDEIALHYGNPRAESPRYDLSLAAGQLLAADRTTVSLSGEEQLRKSSWGEGRKSGKGGVVFWGILALVVVVLLILISRLLPKSSNMSA